MRPMKDIYYNGTIFTGDAADADAMSVEMGRITAVGSLEEIDACNHEGTEIRYHDLNGRFVVPGFNDSHMHLLNYGKTLELIDLTKATASLEEMIQALSAAVSKRGTEREPWIIGRGWNHDFFRDERRFPDRYDLDRVSTECPVLIIRACGHIACANTKAMEMAGITKNTPQPEGGCFDTDKEGNPTGVFREFGVDLIHGAVPPPSKAEIKPLMVLAMKDLNRRGITSVQSDDFAAFPGVPYETVLEAYGELEAEGRMTVRVYEQCLLPDLKSLTDFLAKGYRTGKGSGYFKIGPLKLLADGSLGARTAFLSQPYEDADNSKERGIAIYSNEELEALICLADLEGMQIAVHAIGDGAMEMAADAYQRAMKENPSRDDRRHGIVHCQITTPKLLEAFRRLRLHAYIQSIFLDYDNRIVESRIGKARAKETYQFKTLLSMGVPVSNGSDCPVERPDVMAGIQCAVTRTTLDGTKEFLKDQALSVEEAIVTYTSMGARASFEEEVKGTLSVGKFADFTVLEEDIRKCAPDRIKDTAVLETYVNGVCVYKNENSKYADNDKRRERGNL